MNIWTVFGLRASPFFNLPLEPDPEHPTRPISLFVGRGEEAVHVENRVLGSHSSSTLVSGGYGVGKTTFVRYSEYKLGTHEGVSAIPVPIRLTSTTTPEMLAAELIRRFLDGIHGKGGMSGIVRSKVFRQAEGTVASIDKWTANLSVLGIGGGVGKSQELPPYPIHDLVSLAHRLADKVHRERPDLKIVIHLNNFENVFDPTNPAPARRLFRDIRDLLQLDGVHLLLAGGIDLYGSVISQEEKVSDVIGLPIILGPFDKDAAWLILERRVDHLSRAKETGRIPISRQAFDAMHDAFRGNLRGMFGFIETILETRTPKEDLSIEWEDLVAPARKIAVNHLTSLLNNKDMELLRKAVENFGPDEFRQADLLEVIDINQATLSRTMDRWAKKHVLEIVREERPNKYVRLSGLALIGFGWSPGI
jgi:hypothetical protein